jgi:hypothetical protein
MLGQFRDGRFDLLAQVPLPEQVIRRVRGVLPFQRPMIGLPVLLDGLEQDEGIARAVAQLVLGEVARDRVRPGGELLALVETMQVPVSSGMSSMVGLTCELPAP